MDNETRKLFGIIFLILIAVVIVIMRSNIINHYAEEINNNIVAENKVVVKQEVEDEKVANRAVTLVQADRDTLGEKTSGESKGDIPFNKKILSFVNITPIKYKFHQKMPGNIDYAQDDNGNYYEYVVEKAFADPLIGINDFSFRLTGEIGAEYGMSNTDYELDFKSLAYPYSCKMVAISNEYKEPSEEEKQYFDDETEMVKYYQGLGYNSKNAPNYTVTSVEFTSFFRDYLLGDEWHIDKTVELNPGYIDYGFYSWGKVTMCRIPRAEMIDGEVCTSNITGVVVVFEYYDINDENRYLLRFVK